MESGGRDSPVSDQNRKELSISLAASSMINASDTITQEAYKANLQRIQEVKEIVRMLETNNEAAHKNFLIDQLEKCVKGGREAQDSLVRLRNQQGLSEMVQLPNGVPSDTSNVILPTTATLVEVPESHSYPPHFSSAPTTTSHQPQTIQQRHIAKYQWSLPQHAHQSFGSGVFRYYQPPPTVHQSRQPSAAPHSQAPVDPGQMRWYTSMPPQSRVHKPLVHQMSVPSTQVQQPSSHPSQVTALPPSDTIPAPGYYTSAGLTRAGPQCGPSTSSSSSTYSGPGFPAQSTAFQLPVTTYNQSQNQLSTSTFQIQVPFQGVPAGQAKTHSSHPLPIPSHPLKPPESLFRPVSTAVSNQAISGLQRSHGPPQQLQQQPRQSRPQLQRLVQPPLGPQQHSQKPQPLPQPPLQLKQHPQQIEYLLPSQQSLQLPQSRSQLLPQSTDRVPSISVSQPENQKPQPTIVQEQTRQRGPQLRGDRATFVRAFQKVVQSGPSQLQAFCHHAKTSGISDEWFNAGIDSLPPGVWQSVVAQVNQSERTPDGPPLESAPQQVSMHPGPSALVVGPPPPPIVASSVQIAPAIQLAIKPGTSAQGRVIPASGQTSEPYAAQLRYYAERATKSALYSTHAAGASIIPPANVATTQPSVSISRRDVPQAEAQAKGRMPRDANKSTLARDILRSLGKIVPPQETGSTPIKRVDNQEGDQPPQVTLQPVSDLVSAALPEATRFVDVNSPSIPSAKSNVQNQPQRVDSPSLSTAKSVLEEVHGQAAVIEGPIMIDLTLEDSDESVDGKGQGSTFPIQTAAGAATSSQPISSTNTTNHIPLLENLSLEEEPPVDVAADSDNADMHMHGPPLSPPPVSEENMDSGHLHPSLGSSEPVSPCFQGLPREASEYLIDGQLPLFLPSPPVSPVHTEPPETDLEMTNDEGESRLSLKRRSVDVDVMGIDAGLATPHVKKRGKQQVYVLIPPAPLYVKKAIKKMKERAMGEGIGSEGAEEDEELQYSHLEQLLIEESKSRLLERRCWWLNCSAILNCAANLLAHLRNHAREEGSQAPFFCRWANCQRQFGVEQERDVHFERHTVRPLPCPFSGCGEQFDKPVEVMQHEVQHQKTDHRESLIRKPTSQPIVPAIPARLGAPPQRLPSHRVTPRRVIKCRISADRHATVGPWVLWNIFSPIDLNVRKQNASMRCRPTRQPINYDTDSSDPRRDDYDFLLALLSYPARNPQPDDLDSTLVTMSAARGLTLWGSEPAVNGAAGSATPEGYTSAASATLVVDAAVPGSVTEGTKVDKSDARWGGVPEERQSGPSMAEGEEDAVERILILS